MSRYSEPSKLHADWWDADEDVWLRTKLSFAAGQRATFHVTKIEAVDVTTEEGFSQLSEHMVGVLFEFLDHWTLRQPGKPYVEGKDRPVWELTKETITEQPVGDVAFLFNQVMALYKEISMRNTPSDIITPAAKADGLTPDNFRSGDAA